MAFLIIVLSYGSMFYNIQRTGTQTTKYTNHIKKELTIAKRFFSIVITDSLCWIPIFILKILSLMEVEIPGKCLTRPFKVFRAIDFFFFKDKSKIEPKQKLFTAFFLFIMLFHLTSVSISIEKVKGVQTCASKKGHAKLILDN